MSVGFTTFFPRECPTVFKVINIAPKNKRIKIFNLPIPNGQVRDLMLEQEVSEADIRHALLKGELHQKIKAGEIKVVIGARSAVFAPIQMGFPRSEAW